MSNAEMGAQSFSGSITIHTTLHLGSRTELQVFEARTLDHRLKHRISLVASAAEGQRLMGVRQELQVLGRLGLLLVEVVGAEAGVALVDEDQCLLARDGFADLELTCDGWISNHRVAYYYIRPTSQQRTKRSTYRRAAQVSPRRGRR